MDAESIRRAFEPFFTTKAASSGTGLGLSLSRKIVEGFGGSIHLESEKGRGTLVTVRLLRHEAQTQPAQSMLRLVGATLPRARLLVVDDEESITSSVRSMLEGEYVVEVAGSGREALAKLQGEAKFDLVLCDLTMDSMSGMDLVELLQAQGHYLASKFVFMTGGAVTARAREFVAARSSTILNKPFSMSELLIALAAVREPRAKPKLG